MHEGAVCREIVDIVGAAARDNDIEKVYEIVLSVGPYSCIHAAQLNFYFEVIRKGKVRRAKLYYLRGRVGKAAKVKEDI